MGACLCPPGDLEFVIGVLENREWGPVVNPVVIPWRTWSREASPPPDVFKTGWLSGSRSFSSISLIVFNEEANGWNRSLWNARGWHQEIKWLLCAYIFQKIFCLYFQLRVWSKTFLISFWNAGKKRKAIILFFFFCHYPFWEKRFGLICCQLVFKSFFPFFFFFPPHGSYCSNLYPWNKMIRA